MARSRSLLARVDGALQLRLGHLGAPIDPALTSLVVELLLRAAAGPGLARPQPAPARGAHVVRRAARRRLRLPALGALLVHRAGGDLLRPLGRPALFAL